MRASKPALIGAAVTASALIGALATAEAAPITFSAAGANPAAIQGQVDAYRAELGALNPNVAGSFGTGRREINWDGVPDAVSSPNVFPSNFFNSNSPRGAVFSTPGSGFQVSANAASGTPIEFGNINPAYTDLFQTFSPPRLFTAVGSNVVDVDFFVPGSATPALTRGFGSVFTDVDLVNTSSIEYFDAGGASLGTYYVPAAQGNATLSFLGVDFGDDVVSRVRITNGNAALGPNEVGTLDLVVMDDFLYGEPVARAADVPEPASLALLGTGLLGLGVVVRRRRAS